MQRPTNWQEYAIKDKDQPRPNKSGHQEILRAFLQLGWTKGRHRPSYGTLECEGAPSMKQVKKELIRLAKKYDESEVTY
jgi:hypothetical protein